MGLIHAPNLSVSRLEAAAAIDMRSDVHHTEVSFRRGSEPRELGWVRALEKSKLTSKVTRHKWTIFCLIWVRGLFQHPKLRTPPEGGIVLISRFNEIKKAKTMTKETQEPKPFRATDKQIRMIQWKQQGLGFKLSSTESLGVMTKRTASKWITLLDAGVNPVNHTFTSVPQPVEDSLI